MASDVPAQRCDEIQKQSIRGDPRRLLGFTTYLPFSVSIAGDRNEQLGKLPSRLPCRTASNEKPGCELGRCGSLQEECPTSVLSSLSTFLPGTL